VKKIILCISLMLFSSLSVAGVIQGYGNTKWGMSPDEVVSAENGKAHILSKPVEYSSWQGKVAIDEVNIGSSKYRVTFLFDRSNQLAQTNVTSYEDKNAGINSNNFDTLSSLLSQKYGSPGYVEKNKKNIWVLDGTTIELEHMYMPDIMTEVIITYKPTSRTKKDTEDL